MSPIKPGNYTRDNFPGLSAEAAALREKSRQRVAARANDPEYIALRKRADKAFKEGRPHDALGIMLGADGYENK
jgi:hypothetical protein